MKPGMMRWNRLPRYPKPCSSEKWGQHMSFYLLHLYGGPDFIGVSQKNLPSSLPAWNSPPLPSDNMFGLNFCFLSFIWVSFLLNRLRISYMYANLPNNQERAHVCIAGGSSLWSLAQFHQRVQGWSSLHTLHQLQCQNKPWCGHWYQIVALHLHHRSQQVVSQGSSHFQMLNWSLKHDQIDFRGTKFYWLMRDHGFNHPWEGHP